MIGNHVARAVVGIVILVCAVLIGMIAYAIAITLTVNGVLLTIGGIVLAYIIGWQIDRYEKKNQ